MLGRILVSVLYILWHAGGVILAFLLGREVFGKLYKPVWAILFSALLCVFLGWLFGGDIGTRLIDLGDGRFAYEQASQLSTAQYIVLCAKDALIVFIPMTLGVWRASVNHHAAK